MSERSELWRQVLDEDRALRDELRDLRAENERLRGELAASKGGLLYRQLVAICEQFDPGIIPGATVQAAVFVLAQLVARSLTKLADAERELGLLRTLETYARELNGQAGIGFSLACLDEFRSTTKEK